jgi:uncharacterized protein (DUF952 family)
VTEPIFHIADEADWNAAVAAGAYARSTRGKSLDEVGFIHCSYQHQVQGVADFGYKDATEPLVLLTIDPERVRAEITVENGFPHVYGPLTVDAVIAVQAFDA